MSSYPLVSITITTKNEENNIADCLKSIKQQTYPQKFIEIIVIDNNSIDKTKQIAKKYTKKVFNKDPERSVQRNFGMIEKSKGKYLMFLDADMTLSKTTINKAVSELENTDLGALYIHEIILGDSFFSKVRNFERSFYNGTVIDCVRFIKKGIFRKVGGFDPSLTGPEDWDLDKKIRKIAKTAVLDNAVIYHNEGRFELKNYLSKKSYYSKSFDKYIKKWGKSDADIKKQFSPFYRYFIVFTEHGKWKKLALRPFLTLSIIYLRFLVGLVYLCQKNKIS